MDSLRLDDIETSRITDPASKLAQALEMMAEGFRLKRAALRAAQPSASDSEIDAQLERWLCSDG